MPRLDLIGLGMRHAVRGRAPVRALENFSLAIEPGEFLVLLGPSGSGKTTLLRLIAGLEPPSAGRVEVDGRDLAGTPPDRRDLAMVFQSPALFPHLTVGENLDLPLRLRGVPARERGGRVASLAQMVGVAPLLDRLPETLSGGQKQLAALGRALILKPGVVLLDEPLSSLDPPARAEMRRELKRLHRESGAIFIHVTHDQAEALSLGDRLAILEAGALRQVGTPREIYTTPATRFAARFVGEPPINIFRLTRGGGGAWLEGERPGGGRLPLPEGWNGLDSPFIGARPEQIEVAAGPGGLEAMVEECEFLGRDAVLHCRCQGVGVRALAGAGSAFAEGEAVSLRFKPGGLIPLAE